MNSFKVHRWWEARGHYSNQNIPEPIVGCKNVIRDNIKGMMAGTGLPLYFISNSVLLTTCSRSSSLSHQQLALNYTYLKNFKDIFKSTE